MAKHKDEDVQADVQEPEVPEVETETQIDVEPEVEKEEKVLSVSEPEIAREPMGIVSIKDMKQDEQIKYLTAGLKYLVAKLSPEERVSFYTSIPEFK